MNCKHKTSSFKGILYLNGVKYGQLFTCDKCGKHIIFKTKFISNLLRIDEIARYFCQDCKR